MPSKDKLLFPLNEVERLLACSAADLLQRAASGDIVLVIGVPDGIRFQIFDAENNQTEPPALLEPLLLALTTSHCQKIMLNGGTAQSDYRHGYLIAPNGSLQLLKPSYGKAGRLEHAWAFWRTSKGPYVKEIELTPERLFVVGDDVRQLLEAQTKSQAKAKPKKQEEKVVKLQPNDSADVDEKPLVQAKGVIDQKDVSETISNGNVGSTTQSATVPVSVAQQTILKRPEVEARTGLKRSTIYDKLDPESSRYDATFPKQISLGTRAVGWLESEIDAWIANKQKAR